MQWLSGINFLLFFLKAFGYFRNFFMRMWNYFRRMKINISYDIWVGIYFFYWHLLLINYILWLFICDCFTKITGKFFKTNLAFRFYLRNYCVKHSQQINYEKKSFIGSMHYEASQFANKLFSSEYFTSANFLSEFLNSISIEVGE